MFEKSSVTSLKKIRFKPNFARIGRSRGGVFTSTSSITMAIA